MQDPRIADLFRKYYSRTATDAEETELMGLIAEAKHDGDLLSLMKQEWERLQEVDARFGGIAGKPLLEEILHGSSGTPVRRLLTRHWIRYAAAAVIVLGIGLSIWLAPRKNTANVAFKENSNMPHDVKPGGNKAILTLSDGSSIVLDSAAKGQLARQGNTRIMKTDEGRIVYTPGGAAGLAISNTMTTPRGGQYSLMLPDGSMVWLNAASSITYPASFNGGDRKVSITGEAYFEIANNARHPFVVLTATDQVTVLGTSFNVNAYSGGMVKTSLLGGSVRIGDKILKPGDASVGGNVMKTDLAQDIAWKNGVFNFNRLGLKEVMDQLERWYDITVVYEKDIPKMQFYGEMGRDLTLSQVLKGLEGTGVNFSIEEGKRIVVRNKKKPGPENKKPSRLRIGTVMDSGSFK